MSEIRLAHLAMLLFAALISTTFSFGKLFAADLDPAALTFLRMLFASLLFTLVIAGLGRWRTPSLAEAVQALLLALCVTAFFVTSFIALRTASASETGTIFAIVPLLTAVIAAVTLRQHLPLRMWLALSIAAAGVVFVVFRGSIERLVSFEISEGERAYILGCVAYSAYSPLIRGLNRGAPALLVSYWTTIAGFLLLMVYAAPTVVTTDWRTVPTSLYLGVGYLAVFTTVISFFLIQFASVRLPQAKVIAYTYLVPVFVVLGETAINGALPSLPVLAGVAVITVAMLVLQTARLTPAAAPVPGARDGAPSRDRQ